MSTSPTPQAPPPTKADDESRDQRLAVALSSSELAALATEAAKNGLALASWARMILLRAAREAEQ